MSGESTDGSISPSLSFSIQRILEDDFGQRSTVDEKSPLPAWVFCTRYSDRPSSGSRSRRAKKKENLDEKRPRTAFSQQQLNVLKKEFIDNRYLTEKRRQQLAHELSLNESQIKIWFQNKRAKLKKATMERPILTSLLLSHNLMIPLHSLNGQSTL